MFDQFLFAGLPYVAILFLVVGSVARYKMREFSYSSLSTQFLEDRWLAWASLPWHIGIFFVLVGHLLAFGFPGIWSSLVAIPAFLLAVEALGYLAALLCLLSLIVFLVRRFLDARLKVVTTYADVAVLIILLVQVSTGLAVAAHHRWGAAWAPGALGPYIHSIFLLRPDVSFVREMPPFVKFHIASAWILLMFFPFTRLVHALSVPLHYFVRSPQKVVWNNSRAQVRFNRKDPGR